MNSAPTTRRAGMTLVELLVVMMIIGLLSVAVLPALNRNPDGKRLRDAAEIVSSNLNQQISRALGSSNGSASWYAAEPAAAGAGNGFAVIGLQSGRPRSSVTGSTTVSGSGVVLLALSGSDATLLPSPIQFAGVPGEFTAVSITKVSVSGTAAEDLAMNRTLANIALPLATTTPLPYVLSLPPRQRLQVSAPTLQNNTCIDLSGSTIGVWGFSAVTPLTLADCKTLSIEFDKSGRPTAAWRQLTATGDWKRSLLSATAPLALLIGLRSQAGAGVVATPTTDDPGANWQNPDSRWVILDPRSSAVRIVENSARSTVPAAQEYVLQTLRGL
ncbi:MAG: type II secretion system protein [Planctomycetia bacterium]|nr:type II secretion system protein [Planctomycetia bacterium]